MKRFNLDYFKVIAIVMMGFLLLLNHGKAFAVIEGLDQADGTPGPVTFNLTAKEGHISTPDGSSVLTWGYADDTTGVMQYPGPTLIVDQNDTVTINLTNALPTGVDTSIVFPGQGLVAESGAGTPGLLAREVSPGGGTVIYTFTATHAGTYIYHSGTMPELQIEMGLVGAIIVRPADATLPAALPDPNLIKDLPYLGKAYDHPGAAYHREYLFLLTEMDSRIHDIVEFATDIHSALATLADPDKDYFSNYFPNYWFINGRCGPDTLVGEISIDTLTGGPVILTGKVPDLPNQPYNCLPLMHPGEKLLMRVVNGGRDLHPFHPHGNHQQIIARDGRLRQTESGLGLGPNLTETVYTIQSVPGETLDIIFEWTGAGLGWDMYGHAPGDPKEPFEDDSDHGLPFPVTLPEKQDLAFGGFYSGSEFLKAAGSLPPGEGGLNPWNAYSFIWHSHTEKEIINNDIYPGGMLTMLFVVPHGKAITTANP